MGKTYERIDGRLRTFIEAQPLFFTATAPLSADGTVNLSPKGLRGSFVILDELTVAYLDFAGSNAETIAHLRENGRITLMWCAFEGPPNIVRVVPSAASVRIGTSAASTPIVASRDVWNRSRSRKKKSATSTTTIVPVRMISGASAW
jgi:hypothetical protein